MREITPDVGDEALVVRAQGGDRWAEEALYRRHVRRISDATIRVLGRTAEAEDIVQETFLTALTKLDRLRDPALFERWLLRIAMNRVRSRLRKRKVLRALGLDRGADDATLAQLASRDTPTDVRVELARLDRVLAALPPQQRMAWMLHWVEGFTLPETAEACGCSLATVKRWIRVVRITLEDHVAEEAGDA
ncbi:MAG: RNA polymerase sigma factor [Sandaracinaceae bacterium]